MMNETRKAWSRRHDTLVIDKNLDAAFFWLWFVYAGWGFTSVLVNVTVLDIPFLQFYPTLWGAVIGLCGLVASATIMAGFYTASDQFTERITQKRVEVVAVATMGGFIAVYPLLQWLRIFTPDADPGRVDTAVLGLSYLVMPIFRVHLQPRRANAVRMAKRNYLEELHRDDGETRQ